MVTVYTWGSNITGHAAVETSESRYLSFHPDVIDKMRLIEGQSYKPAFTSLDDDLRDKGRPREILIDSIDSRSVSRAIDALKASPPRYQLYGPNCSSLSIQVLRAGISDHKKASFLEELVDSYHHFFPPPSRGVGWADHISQQVMEQLPRLAHAVSRSRGNVWNKSALGLIVAVSSVNNLVVESPADVVAFAEGLNRHH